MPTIAEAITLLSVFIAGILSTRGMKKSGWMYGFLAACSYYVILILVSLIAMGGLALNNGAVRTILLGLLFGAIGGIVGINTKTKPVT